MGKKERSIFLLIMAAFAAAITGCVLPERANPTPTARYIPTIYATSVRQCWDQAMTLAHEWRPDAYIVEVTIGAKWLEIPLSPGVNYVIQSPIEDMVSFFVVCKEDGARTGTIDQNPGWPLDHSPPLSPDMFVLDSQEALTIALQNAGTGWLSSPRSYIELWLSHDNFRYPERTVWRVFFSELGGRSTNVYVDAVSGEVLGVR